MGDRNLLQFSKEKRRVLPWGGTSPGPGTGWGTQLESSLAEKALGVLVGTKLTASQQRALGQRRLVVSWAALAKVLPAGGGR